MNSKINFLIIILVLLFGSVSYAQSSGTIEGVITDTQNNALPYASVMLKGTNKGAMSDNNGRYVISNVAEGDYTITAEFLGFITFESEISVIQSKNIKNIQLEAKSTSLNEVLIYGEYTRGQAKSLNEQKNAGNIRNVVSSEEFSNFPDRNAAETLQRFAGVSITRDKGEGEFVQLRGLSSGYNSVQLNGQVMPSTNPYEDGRTSRSVGLNTIQSQLMDEIEISKTLTPDQEGAAIAGVVNMRMKAAPRKPILSASANVGFNNGPSDFEAHGRSQQNYDLTLGKRFLGDKLGMMASGSYYFTDRQLELQQFTYLADDEGDYSNLGDLDILQQNRWNDYDIQRKRLGLLFAPDYKFDDENKIRVIYNYNHFTEEMVRRRSEYEPLDNLHSKENRNRDEEKDLHVLQVIGENKIGGFKIDYVYNYMRENYASPNQIKTTFQRKLPGLRNLSTQELKNLTGASNYQSDILLKLDGNISNFNKSYANDINNTFSLNISKDYNLFEHVSNLKFGGKYSTKKVLKDGEGYNVATTLEGTTIRADKFYFPEDNIYENPAVTVGDLNYISSSKLKEDIIAGYAQTNMVFSDAFSALYGVRLEQTKNSFFKDRNGIASTLSDGGDADYLTLLPSVNLTYKINDNMNLKGAVTKGILRPSYDQLIPVVAYSSNDLFPEDDNIFEGNPDLKPERAINYDLMYSWYGEKLGFVTVGLFAKSMSDLIYINSRSEERTYADGDGNPVTDNYTIRTPRNANDGNVMGVEIGFNKMFDFIKMPWLGITGNYTYTHTEFTDENNISSPMPNSPKHVANMSLVYDNAKNGITVRLSGNYRGPLLLDRVNSTLINHDFGDHYFDEQFYLDFTLRYNLNKHIQFNGSVKNLTNEYEREVFGDPYNNGSRLHQYEKFGQTFSIGLRYNL